MQLHKWSVWHEKLDILKKNVLFTLNSERKIIYFPDRNDLKQTSKFSGFFVSILDLSSKMSHLTSYTQLHNFQSQKLLHRWDINVRLCFRVSIITACKPLLYQTRHQQLIFTSTLTSSVTGKKEGKKVKKLENALSEETAV